MSTVVEQAKAKGGSETKLWSLTMRFTKSPIAENVSSKLIVEVGPGGLQAYIRQQRRQVKIRLPRVAPRY